MKLCLVYILMLNHCVSTVFSYYVHTKTKHEFDTKTQQVNESLDGQHKTNGSDQVNGLKNFQNMINSPTQAVSETTSLKHLAQLRSGESCRNKCGQIQMLPCSCDLKCLVYKNCCEDMSLVCPELLQESRIRYGHMLDMKVECTMEDSFVITSCGNGQKSRTQKLDLNRDALDTTTTMNLISKFLMNSTMNEVSQLITTIKISQLPTKQPVKDIHDIIDIINNAYVTDTVTGFTYKNMEIFSCAAGELSNPVKWTAKFVGDTFLTPSLDTILQGISQVYYSPPTNLISDLLPASCRYDSIGACDDSIIKNNIDLLYKCQQFISYFTSGSTTYNNRFCQQCNIDFAQTDRPKSQRNSFSFSLTMTLSGNSLQIQPGNVGSKKHFSWTSLMCELSQSDSKNVSSTKELCEQSCEPRAVRMDDGRCMYSYTVIFAVSDDNYTLTLQESDSFPEFARCFLKTHSELLFQDNFSPTMRLIDHRLNINLYASLTYIFYTRLNIDDFDKLFRPTLSLMSKVFKAYRMLTRKSSPNDVFMKNTRDYLNTYSSDQSSWYTRVLAQIVHNESNDCTVFCAMSSLYSPFNGAFIGNNDGDIFKCIKAPTVLEDTDIIKTYLNSACFSIFTAHSNVCGKTFEPPMFMLVFICLIAIYCHVHISLL